MFVVDMSLTAYANTIVKKITTTDKKSNSFQYFGEKYISKYLVKTAYPHVYAQARNCS